MVVILFIKLDDFIFLFFLFLDGSFYLQALSLLLFILCLSSPHPLYKIALINKLKLIATLNICQVLADFHHRLSRTFGGTIPGGFRRGWSAGRGGAGARAAGGGGDGQGLRRDDPHI